MAQNLVIVPGQTWELYVPGLPSQANTKIDKVNPTLEVGDVKFYYPGGSYTNLATAPVVSPAGTTQVKITITGAESTAWEVGKQVVIRLSDVSGDEWCDVSIIAVVGEDIALSSLATAAALDVVDTVVDNILTDTGTTLDTLIKDIPTNAEFELRTLPSADYVVTGDLPTVDAIWDEILTSGHAVPGSAAVILSAAGGAADPLLNVVPGDYPSGTAGNALGKITSSTVNITSPIDEQQNISLNVNSDYYSDHGWAIDLESTSWPTLTNAEIFMGIEGHEDLLDGEVITANKIRFEFAKEELALIGNGRKKYEIYAILDGANEYQVLLAKGRLLIEGITLQ